MKVISPQPDHEMPRGVVGGSEISEATAGARSIYMGLFRVEPGARSRPHYHATCESAVLMLSGELDVAWGDALQERTTIRSGDMVYVPPHETHVLTNPSADVAAEYVVSRNAATEDSVEVPWAG